MKTNLNVSFFYLFKGGWGGKVCWIFLEHLLQHYSVQPWNSVKVSPPHLNLYSPHFLQFLLPGWVLQTLMLHFHHWFANRWSRVGQLVGCPTWPTPWCETRRLYATDAVLGKLQETDSYFNLHIAKPADITPVLETQCDRFLHSLQNCLNFPKPLELETQRQNRGQVKFLRTLRGRSLCVLVVSGVRSQLFWPHFGFFCLLTEP